MTSPTSVERYFVYTYEHLDDLAFTRSPTEVLDEQGRGDLVEAVSSLFRRHGWEGDGAIRIIWLPPFVDVGIQDTHGTYVWMVKQRSNGTSFIASACELPFKRLLAQNGNREVWQGYVPFGKARHSRVTLVQTLNCLCNELDKDISACATLAVRGSEITHSILERTQGHMIQALQNFCDDCYLSLLVDVITDGNRCGIKLRKSPVRLDPGRYLPSDADSDTDGWFTLRGLVSDMWSDYQFQPFDTKLEMLFKPVEFKPQESSLSIVKLHVFLRNCVQHHGGQVEERGLKRLGRTGVDLLGPNGKLTRTEPWRPISFSRPELSRLREEILALASAFDTHLEAALAARDYSPAEQGLIPAD